MRPLACTKHPLQTVLLHRSLIRPDGFGFRLRLEERTCARYAGCSVPHQRSQCVKYSEKWRVGKRWCMSWCRTVFSAAHGWNPPWSSQPTAARPSLQGLEIGLDGAAALLQLSRPCALANPRPPWPSRLPSLPASLSGFMLGLGAEPRQLLPTPSHSRSARAPQASACPRDTCAMLSWLPCLLTACRQRCAQACSSAAAAASDGMKGAISYPACPPARTGCSCSYSFGKAAMISRAYDGSQLLVLHASYLKQQQLHAFGKHARRTLSRHWGQLSMSDSQGRRASASGRQQLLHAAPLPGHSMQGSLLRSLYFRRNALCSTNPDTHP